MFAARPRDLAPDAQPCRSARWQHHREKVRVAWVKLIDFETTLPSPVEELYQQRAQRQSA